MLDPMYVDVGAAIRKRREGIGMTQATLGQHLGLTRTSVTNIECGRQAILVHQLCRAAHAMRVDPATLLPEPNPSSENSLALGSTVEFEELLSKLSSTASGAEP